MFNNEYPNFNCILTKDESGKTIIIKKEKFGRNIPKDFLLKCGDIIECHLEDNDKVILTDQFSKLDFDGDDCNVYVNNNNPSEK